MKVPLFKSAMSLTFSVPVVFTTKKKSGKIPHHRKGSKRAPPLLVW